MSVALAHGHDPADVREWAWRDVQLLIVGHQLQSNTIGSE
jgi:hypothetical protein